MRRAVAILEGIGHAVAYLLLLVFVVTITPVHLVCFGFDDWRREWGALFLPSSGHRARACEAPATGEPK